MPQLKFTGDRVTAGTVGPRQVKAIPTSKNESAPIQYDRWARNGKHPNVALFNQMQNAVNSAVMFGSKQVFSSGAAPLHLCLPIVSSADRARWRFAFHTSQYTHALYAVVCMLPPDVDIAPPGYASTSGRLDVANGAGAVIATQSFTYGTHPAPRFTGLGGYVPDWKHVKWFTKYIDGVAADTDYFGTFYDVNYGRLQSACVFELPSMTELAGGYLAENLTAGSPILDVYREKQATIMRNLWRRAGATLLTWSVDDGTTPVAIATSTPTNIIDGTTVINASAAPFTFMMNGKNRRTVSAGIPCRMVAYGRKTSGAADGTVYLKNSAGTTVASIVNAWGTTAIWQQVAFNMPAVTDDYYLMFSRATAASTFELYAVSIYPYTT